MIPFNVLNTYSLILNVGIITCEIIHGSLYKSIIHIDNINENRE
jgi:hypothetical protein